MKALVVGAVLFFGLAVGFAVCCAVAKAAIAVFAATGSLLAATACVWLINIALAVVLRLLGAK